MSWLDIVVLIAVGIPVVIGFRRGFVGIIVPLAGVGLAIILAIRFYGLLADWLSLWLDSSMQCNVVAFGVILVLVVGAALVLSSLLRGFLRLVLLGWVDNFGGAVLGLAVGGLVPAVLLTFAVRYCPSATEDAIRGSNVATFLLDRFTSVASLLPEELDAVRQFFG